MNFEKFAKHIADESVQLCNAKPAPATDKPVTVVLDPDLVALFAHEIIGHPSELDRALKWETGYAGRSWFFEDLKKNMVGKQVGSSLLTAFSDPTLKGGYGYYLYDDEGVKAKRVYHIKDGVYQDFMNSRETASILGKEPNGHYKANDASVVPLIRMSASAIAPGKSNPKKIISDVEHGYYAVGHRIPSISESRENFQIAPRLIYEIKNGEIGQVYRNGRITYDSKSFFMSIDALGNDFKIFPIPNCGKGQPMQAKQVGNGGPTARGRARIARGN
jgi:TldD protein